MTTYNNEPLSLLRLIAIALIGFGALLISAVSYASEPRVIVEGTFQPNMPVTQSTRVFRDGVVSECASQKNYSTIDTGVFPSSGSAHQFVSPFPHPTCYEFTFSVENYAACNSIELFPVVYQTAYSAAAPTLNAIADPGNSTTSIEPIKKFRGLVPGGATIIMVASTVLPGNTQGSSTCKYRFDAAPISATHYTQTSTYSGTTSSPVRLARDGVPTTCATTGKNPGVSTGTAFSTTGSKHIFTNPHPVRKCFTFSYTTETPSTCGTSFAPFAAAYSPSYDSANPTTNLIGDAGNSVGSSTLPPPTPENPASFSAYLEPNAKVVFVVMDSNGTSGGGSTCNYTVSIAEPVNLAPCSLDVDGDGTVTATIDSIIHARIALGMRGSSVLAGITFPTGAKRTDWNAVRDYLNGSCGMSVTP